MNRIGLIFAILLSLFPLSSAQTALHIAILGDRTGTADDTVFESTLKDIENLKPDLVINVGDLIEGPQPDEAAIHREWDHVLTMLKTLSMPVRFVPGNNDIFNDTSRALYPQRTGTAPYYSFDVGLVHIVILDVSQIRSFENMSRDQLDWLTSDLDAHRSASMTCVFLHKPFWLDSEQSGTLDEMHTVFLKGGVDWVFSGHYHSNVYMAKDGIRYQMIGSSGGHIGDNPERGEFYQFGWFTIDEGEAECAIVRPGLTESGMVLSTRDSIAQNAIDETLTSNFLFDMSARRSAGDIPLSVTLSNPGDGPFSGTFAWEDEGSAWQLKPKSGAYAIDGASTLLSFTAVQRRGEVYPLPRIAIVCPLGSEKTYTSLQRPALRLTASVPSTRKTITLDGQLKDKAWKKAVILDEFGSPDGLVSAIEPTRVRLIHDSENLFIGLECTESQPESMSVSGDARDTPVFEGDCVFLMFWSGEPPENCTQIVVNPRGVFLDQKGPVATSKQGRPQLDPKWNGDVSAVSSHEKDAWYVEFRIPFAELDLPVPSDGRTIRFNLIRFQSRLQDSSSWCWPATYAWEDTGLLKF